VSTLPCFLVGHRTRQPVCWNFVRRLLTLLACYAQHTHTHTHTRLTALFPGLPRWAGTRKVKPISISLKQETVSGSGISWAICKSAPRSRQITTPAPHHFLRPNQQCQSTEGTALKAPIYTRTLTQNNTMKIRCTFQSCAVHFHSQQLFTDSPKAYHSTRYRNRSLQILELI